MTIWRAHFFWNTLCIWIAAGRKAHSCYYTNDSITGVFIIRPKSGPDSEFFLINMLISLDHYPMDFKLSGYDSKNNSPRKIENQNHMLWMDNIWSHFLNLCFCCNFFYISDYSFYNIIYHCRRLESFKEKYEYLSFQTENKLSQWFFSQ